MLGLMGDIGAFMTAKMNGRQMEKRLLGKTVKSGKNH
jgi:hypothetical protein